MVFVVFDNFVINVDDWIILVGELFGILILVILKFIGCFGEFSEMLKEFVILLIVVLIFCVIVLNEENVNIVVWFFCCWSLFFNLFWFCFWFFWILNKVIVNEKGREVVVINFVFLFLLYFNLYIVRLMVSINKINEDV